MVRGDRGLDALAQQPDPGLEWVESQSAGDVECFGKCTTGSLDIAGISSSEQQACSIVKAVSDERERAHPPVGFETDVDPPFGLFPPAHGGGEDAEVPSHGPRADVVGGGSIAASVRK